MHKFFSEACSFKFDRRKVPPRGRANRQPGFGLDGPAKAAAPRRRRPTTRLPHLRLRLDSCERTHDAYEIIADEIIAEAVGQGGPI